MTRADRTRGIMLEGCWSLQGPSLAAIAPYAILQIIITISYLWLEEKLNYYYNIHIPV